MMKHTHFFEELPDKYIDSAFLDRLHCYNPGWESSPIRSELFTEGFGFIVDYIAEILRHLRGIDYLHAYQEYFELSPEITTRDRDGVQKTFSGLMKILFPDGTATKAEIEELLILSLEGRRRVKEQLIKLDETFSPVDFSYTDRATKKSAVVITLEERQHPTLARQSPGGEPMAQASAETVASRGGISAENCSHAEPKAQAGHIVFSENRKNISYRKLFAAHLQGARDITVVDPYVRTFWQIRNFMEFVQLVRELTPEGEEAKIHLVTKSDPDRCVEQDENIRKIQESCAGTRVSVEFSYDQTDTLHARSITTDTGWKISLDRGLDIFLRYEINAFSLVSSVQEERMIRSFEVTYIRNV
jgi:ATP-dependent Lon protease